MRGPFGLAPYSTPSADEAEFFVRFNYVPQPHPDLIEYRGTWQPGTGLVQVSANSRRFEDDESGFRAFDLYRKLKKSLSQRYGEPQSDESAMVEEGPIPSIHYDDASCISMWDFSTKKSSDEYLDGIGLMILTDSHDCSYIDLMYRFKNDSTNDQDKFSSVL